MRSIVIFRFFSHLPLLFVYQCITFLPLIFRFSLYTSCLVAVCSLFYNNETSTLDSLAFQNVEALASGENDDNAICVGYGSVDCRTYKVKYKVTDFSLD